jgi:SAM-dependent methyltransferase
MKGVKRSYELFQAFRHEGTDPATFYSLLADDTVRDVAEYCQVVGARVLDVGGASGYVADVFREIGSKTVTAEYDFSQMVEHGRRLVNGVAADGCELPFATGSMDISYSSNVLEHVVSPQRMLSEMIRVVAPGGVVYLTFTNWLSPWGGHETSPWHYRGGEWAARRYRRVHGVEPKNRYGKDLFRLGVGQVLRWCQTRSDVTVVDAFPRYYPRWTRPLVRIPGLRELLTWNLVVVMRRTDSAPDVGSAAESTCVSPS